MRILICLFCIPFFTFGQPITKKIRVLFIGNSYTHVNTLPVLISSVAVGNGDTLIHDNYTPGGYSLSNHYNDPACIAKIAQGNWQYVVLQAQSQEPSFSPSQVNNQTLPFVLKLDSVIKKYNPCATTVFYETWGRKNGDQGNCGSYPPVCTYTGMQNRLRDSYRLFADTVKGIIAPVGEAFRASISGNPTLDLYQFDQSHPSLNGSYLAAIVFYETLFQKNVLGNQYNPGVGTADSWYLQQKAHAIVHDSLATWNQGLYHPWAGFLTAINGLVVQFNSQSNTLLNKWYFGDGNTSVLPNPSHTYAAPGTYTVTHVVDSGCKRDSVTKVITVSTSVGIKEQALRTEEILWPNPATNQLYLSETLNSVTARIQINDLGGRLLLDIKCEPEINISGLMPGVYILNYEDNERQLKIKFVKTKN